MTTPGYVYVLVNKAMPGLLKIGMTTRNPQLRANELSNATGVPTPFEVLYQQHTGDCVNAERIVHATLESVGLREAGNREFFRAPLHQVLFAVVQAAAVLDGRRGAHASQSLDDFLAADKISWLAREFKEGSDRVLRDEWESLSLSMTAAMLGHPAACVTVAHSFHYEPVSGPPDLECAISYYDRAVEAGHWYAHAHKGTALSQLGRQDEAVESWRAFFRAAARAFGAAASPELPYQVADAHTQFNAGAWLLWKHPIYALDEAAAGYLDTKLDVGCLAPVAAQLRTVLAELKPGNPRVRAAIDRLDSL